MRYPMSKLTFRNSQGKLVDIPTVAATKVKNEFGSVLDQATHGGAVAITRHETPKAVLLSYQEFQALVNRQSPTLDHLANEFDTLLNRMQTGKAKRGADTAFRATPKKLAQAALNAAPKNKTSVQKQSRHRTNTSASS